MEAGSELHATHTIHTFQTSVQLSLQSKKTFKIFFKKQENVY